MEEGKEGLLEPVGSRAPQENPQNQLTLAYRSCQSLIQQPGSLCGTDLGPLCICYNCAIWSFYETPNCEGRGCLWFCCLHLAAIPPTGLPHPALTEEEVPSLTIIWYIMIVWYPWEACSYLKRNSEGVDGGKKINVWTRRRGERSFVWNIKTNKQQKKKQ